MGWDTGLSDTRSTCCVLALLSRSQGVNRLPWALPRLVPPVLKLCAAGNGMPSALTGSVTCSRQTSTRQWQACEAGCLGGARLNWGLPEEIRDGRG